jgi:mono/diheme cytochrome c family protein
MPDPRSNSFIRGFALAMGVGILALAAVVGGTIALGRASTSGGTTTVTVAAPATTGTTTTTTGATLPKDPQVVAGAYTFTQFACAQCHGMQGRGGVSPDVPALTTIGAALTVSRLKNIIDHGLGVRANPKKPFMPVWGEVISKRQVADLVAYIKVGLPDVPTAHPQPIVPGTGQVEKGAILYSTFGCINCHGPNGLGGVPNPSSPDKSIPPLSGADFRHQFDTAAKIRAIVESGSVIGRAPIVSMPHWGGIISRPELDALVAYIRTLK